MLKGAIRDDIARLDRKYRHRIFPAPSPDPKKRDYFNSLLSQQGDDSHSELNAKPVDDLLRQFLQNVG